MSHKSHHIELLPIIDKLVLVTLTGFIVIIIITMEVLPNPKPAQPAPTPTQPDANVPTKGLEMGDVKMIHS